MLEKESDDDGYGDETMNKYLLEEHDRVYFEEEAEYIILA